MKRWIVAGVGLAVTLVTIMPATALFIFHPLISRAIWGPHYAAYPPDTAYYPSVVTPSPSVVVVPPVGSYERTLPAGCTSLTVNSASYFRCGTVYYKPTFVGTTLMYEVVTNPG
jgi:hypothetical protein